MKLFRLIGYLFFFAISFVFFLYWMFPYDALRGRLAGVLEQQLGSNVDVEILSLKPSAFSGMKAKRLSINMREKGEILPLLNIDEAIAKISFFSLLFGTPRLDFSLQCGKGMIRGTGRRSGVTIELDIDVEDFDLASLQIFSSRYGLHLTSRIDGSFRLTLDQQNFLRSNGKADLVFRALSLQPSEIEVAGTIITLPEIVFSRGKNARLSAEMIKGALSIETLKFEGGDIGLDLSGKIFLSQSISNLRLNLNGSFRDSPKLTETFPVFFLIEKQKTAYGTYPLSITGPVTKPSVKIGSFSLPI